jgi:hypothetical protein
VLGFEALDFEFQGYEAVHAPVEEKEVEGKVALSHLKRDFGADEAEAAGEFGDEVAQLGQQAAMKAGL